jgi:hypothetical protein
MKNQLMKSFFVLAFLALVALPMSANAQTSSDVGLSISTGSATVNRGGGVAVFGLVTNNTTSKMRTNVSVSALSPCGTETSLGEMRLSIEAGKSVALSIYYPISADACQGMYTLSISADSGKSSGKNATSAALPSASAYFEVK